MTPRIYVNRQTAKEYCRFEIYIEVSDVKYSEKSCNTKTQNVQIIASENRKSQVLAKQVKL